MILAGKELPSTVTRPQLQRESLLQWLRDHRAADDLEQFHCDRMAAFVSGAEKPFSRAQADGHVTASAFVIDPSGDAMLLLWHAKLQRWLQPGGHVEDSDETLAAAAWRELLEETCGERSDFELVAEHPLDFDVHPIPGRGTEAAHFHHDVRFLFRARSRDVSPSAGPVEWRPLAEVAANPDASLARVARKIVRRPNLPDQLRTS